MRFSRNGSCLLLLAGLLAGCASGYKPYECAVDPRAAAVDPHAIWSCHRDTMHRIVKGKKFTLLEFREASDFFGRLTSIEADGIPSRFGPVPTDELKQILPEWDAWYERNGDRLTWDATERAVELTGGEPAG